MTVREALGAIILAGNYLAVGAILIAAPLFALMGALMSGNSSQGVAILIALIAMGTWLALLRIFFRLARRGNWRNYGNVRLGLNSVALVAILTPAGYVLTAQVRLAMQSLLP